MIAAKEERISFLKDAVLGKSTLSQWKTTHSGVNGQDKLDSMGF